MHTSDDIAQRLMRASIEEMHQLVHTVCMRSAAMKNGAAEWEDLVEEKEVIATLVSSGWTLKEYSDACLQEITIGQITTKQLAMKYAFFMYGRS